VRSHVLWLAWIISLAVACQCGGPTTDGRDAGEDAGSGAADDAGGHDAGMNELDSGIDGRPSDAGPADSGQVDSGEADAGQPDGGVLDAGEPGDSGTSDAGAGTDSGTADAGPFFIQIDISNTCVVSTTPASVSAPLNSGLYLTFYNHSVDYDADVWSSRGYGYLGLVTQTTWNDPVEHCGGPQPYTEYFDVNIAGGPTQGCPGVRFNISCE
jgi:hypothetical protein